MDPAVYMHLIGSNGSNWYFSCFVISMAEFFWLSLFLWYSVDVLRDQSLEDNPKSKPAAKRRREIKQTEKGDEDLLKDDGTLVAEHSTIPRKSPFDKQHTRNATLDGSSIGAPKAVHLQSVSPSNENRKGEKKSAKTFNQETSVVPCTMTNVGIEHFGTHNNSSYLGENPAAAVASGQHIQDVMSSEPEPDAIYPKDKQGNPAQEINLRPSSLEIGTRNKEAGNVEGGHEASGAVIASNINRKRASKNRPAIFAEKNSCIKVQASNKAEKENKISRHENEIHKDKQNHASNQNDGAEHQSHVSGQNDRVEEREFSVEISSKTASSEKYEIYAQYDLCSKAKEAIVGSKLLETSETVDPPKLSKKRKRSKNTHDLVSVTPPTSATEHVKGFISSISPTKTQKIANGDHLSDTFCKEESTRLQEVRKETDTMSTSLATNEEINDVILNGVATDEEINDVIQNVVTTDEEINGVIQNVVESVQQMVKDQVDTDSMHGKSRKKSRKKQNSDVKLPQSLEQNENTAKNNVGDMC
ncbi:uncharacterized protein [Euphorbia lathyris]|uniref:uncharacterized protein n=1 Tax=Euphorbia lathyris TaxID=212925 RepID=UPI003313D199